MSVSASNLHDHMVMSTNYNRKKTDIRPYNSITELVRIVSSIFGAMYWSVVVHHNHIIILDNDIGCCYIVTLDLIR